MNEAAEMLRSEREAKENVSVADVVEMISGLERMTWAICLLGWRRLRWRFSHLKLVRRLLQ